MKTAEITPEIKTDWACNVAIVGRSGTGKTSSLEQLPELTGSISSATRLDLS